ncbi:hypothetical protein [Flavobacterium beibuense]|uniref:hypothetical protein n=1 Tax=Flavobacterium beibuense TaxID=657326 RepID=UPI003A8EE25B
MQNFKSLYLELSAKLSEIDAIEWIDIWNNQVYDLEQEHPFPAPAVFLAFRSNNMTDTGTKVQKVSLQVDVFLFYETFADTYDGAYNQGDALRFIDIIDEINKLLHGSEGQEYSSMRRTSFSPLDGGGAGNLFNITYNCELMDYSANIEHETDSYEDINLQPKTDNKFVIRG